MPFPVESCLSERMRENLNAEIAIDTINSVVDAVGYLTWTFYSRRVKANPSYYGAVSGKQSDVEDYLLGIVNETLSDLEEAGCVVIEQGNENDREVRTTNLGRTAANFYLLYHTPQQMMFGVNEARNLISSALEADDAARVKQSGLNSLELSPLTRSTQVDEISLAWILYALSSTHEFDELPVRHNEEHLNADLSLNVMWGADTSVLTKPEGKGRVSPPDLDIMGDPHTK